MNDPVVTRLHGCLVDAIRRGGREPTAGPFKVSEIYQDLVPYREVRATLGVELNADYEHALLRLLAGEGGLLRLEPESAREELRREVESPYPFVGMYRKFSASDVWITAEPADAPAAAPSVSAVADGGGNDAGMPDPAEAANTAGAPAGPTTDARTPEEAMAAARHGPPPPARVHERRIVAHSVECSFCNQ
ncbi:MAG TPA: hypothetical protein VJ957_01710, partial [Longimicrobiales bacterium]|nr:hypothetical protein [Longimicrobiales bacterium]